MEKAGGIQKILRVDGCSGDIRNHLRSCHLTKLILSTKVNLYLSDQLGHFHPTRAADEHE